MLDYGDFNESEEQEIDLENFVKWSKRIREDDPCGDRKCNECEIGGCEHNA